MKDKSIYLPKPSDLEFGEHLKKSRKYMKMTQQELATKAGIHVTNIIGYEKGDQKPREETYKELLKTLNVPAHPTLELEEIARTIDLTSAIELLQIVAMREVKSKVQVTLIPTPGHDPDLHIEESPQYGKGN